MANRKHDRDDKYKPKSFETRADGRDGKVYARIYNTMLKSQAWRNLSKNARDLYVHMKAQYYAQPDIEGCPDGCFYFNRGMWQEDYKLYKNQNQFYKDRDLLVKHGFIEIYQNGKNTRTKTIYMFSNKWNEEFGYNKNDTS